MNKKEGYKMSNIILPNEIETVQEENFNDIVISASQQQSLLNNYSKQIDKLQKEYDAYGYDHSSVKNHLTKIEILKTLYIDLTKLFLNAKLDNIPRQPYTITEMPPQYFIYGFKHKEPPFGLLVDCWNYKEEKFFISPEKKELEYFTEDILFSKDNYDALVELKNTLKTKDEKPYNESYYVYKYYIGEQQHKLVITELKYDY